MYSQFMTHGQKNIKLHEKHVWKLKDFDRGWSKHRTPATCHSQRNIRQRFPYQELKIIPLFYNKESVCSVRGYSRWLLWDPPKARINCVGRKSDFCVCWTWWYTEQTLGPK